MSKLELQSWNAVQIMGLLTVWDCGQAIPTRGKTQPKSSYVLKTAHNFFYTHKAPYEQAHGALCA